MFEDIKTFFYDSRISQIAKILVKVCPKYLDLYVNIYGNQNFMKNTLFFFYTI